MERDFGVRDQTARHPRHVNGHLHDDSAASNGVFVELSSVLPQSSNHHSSCNLLLQFTRTALVSFSAAS